MKGFITNSGRVVYYIPRQLTLGKHYVLAWGSGPMMLCKFIQPTKCGYNFLNLDTNKCVLKKHLYPSNKENHASGDWFWVNKMLKILPIPK